jgi:hypothetical protein
MFKFLSFIGIIYGIGFIGAAISRAAGVWESMDSSNVVEDAMLHGLLWPAMLIDWLA